MRKTEQLKSSQIMYYEVLATDGDCNAFVIGKTKTIEEAEAVALKHMKELEEKQYDKDCYIWIEEGNCEVEE